jgi:hypothetical protein
MTFEQKIRAKIRVWWRPVSCIGISIGVCVNAVYLPLSSGEPLEPMGFAAIITACSTAFAVREWGKIRGSDSDTV